MTQFVKKNLFKHSKPLYSYFFHLKRNPASYIKKANFYATCIILHKNIFKQDFFPLRNLSGI